MTKKKINFFQKPVHKDDEEIIDNWVRKEGNKKFKRTTVYLTEELHKKLKIEAAKRNTTMTELIIDSVEKQLLNCC
jgi:hypothetical protein